MPKMSHNTALKEQQQILDQSMDSGEADDQGWEQVMQRNENERPQSHQIQQSSGIEQQQSQQPEHKQPQTQQSHTQTSQTEQPQTQQSTIQQMQAHPPHQIPEAQEEEQAPINQHTLSDAEVQTLCAETIKARDRAYCTCATAKPSLYHNSSSLLTTSHRSLFALSCRSHPPHKGWRLHLRRQRRKRRLSLRYLC